MLSFFEALSANPLLLSAVIAGFAASIVSGIIGSYVVVKRIGFLSGSISHSVLSGIGISLWLERAKGITWISPLLGALLAAIASALIVGWIHLFYRQREDSVIAALWAIGMAVGVLPAASPILESVGLWPDAMLTSCLVHARSWTPSCCGREKSRCVLILSCR